MLDKTYFASYAIKTSTKKGNFDQVIRNIQKISIPLLQWFENEKIKINPDKCNLLLSGNEYRSVSMTLYN